MENYKSNIWDIIVYFCNPAIRMEPIRVQPVLKTFLFRLQHQLHQVGSKHKPFLTLFKYGFFKCVAGCDITDILTERRQLRIN